MLCAGLLTPEDKDMARSGRDENSIGRERTEQEVGHLSVPTSGKTRLFG